MTHSAAKTDYSVGESLKAFLFGAAMLNPKFSQAYAIAKAIPKRKNKRSAILKWCKAAKEAIGG